MKWFTELYAGESIADKVENIKQKIAGNIKVKNVYLITLPANNKNMLDIIPLKMGKIITWREIYVIGIAGSKKEAVNLTSEIITAVYNETGAFNLKEYFNDYD